MTDQTSVGDALRSLGLASLAEFASQQGLQWMNLNDPVDRRIIELAVVRAARYQEVFFSVE